MQDSSDNLLKVKYEKHQPKGATSVVGAPGESRGLAGGCGKGGSGAGGHGDQGAGKAGFEQ